MWADRPNALKPTLLGVDVTFVTTRPDVAIRDVLRATLPVAVIGLLFSAIAAVAVHQQIRAASERNFQRDSEMAVNSIDREIERHVNVIDDISAFASATWPGDLHEWRRYLDGRVTAGNYLAFTSTAGLIERVPFDEVAEFEERERVSSGEPFGILDIFPAEDGADRLVLTRTGEDSAGGINIRGIEVSSVVGSFNIDLPGTSDGLQVGRLHDNTSAVSAMLRMNEEALADNDITSTDVLFVKAIGDEGSEPLGWVIAPAELGFLLRNAADALSATRTDNALNIRMSMSGIESVDQAGTYIGTEGLPEAGAPQQSTGTLGVGDWKWEVSTWAPHDYGTPAAGLRALFILVLGSITTLAAMVFVQIRQRHQAELTQASFELSLQRTLAETDPLTGLLNRQGLSSRIADRSADAAFGHDGASVLFVDLDGFKAVNDQHGHAAGDALLIAVAQQIRGTVREGDIVSRLGGDEFVVVAPGLNDRREAASYVNRLTAAVRSIEDPLPIRCSVGRTTAETGPVNFPALLADADASMYRAKKANHLMYRMHGVAGSNDGHEESANARDTRTLKV